MNIRAMTDADKQKKKQLILIATEELLISSSYESVKMLEIAQKTGIAKGTLFNYFTTKEELFLELLMKKYEDWFLMLSETLKKRNVSDFETFKSVFIEGITNHILLDQAFYRLIALMHPILEKNIPVESAVRFKCGLYEKLGLLSAQIVNQVPFFDQNQSALLLMSMHVIMVGVINMASASECVKKVVQDYSLTMFDIDPVKEVHRIISIYLDGLLHQKSCNIEST